MKELPSIDAQSRYRLALSYAIAGYGEEAVKLISGARLDSEYDESWAIYTYGSQMRDKAMILETLSYLDKKEDAFAIVRELAEQMGEKNRWMSTQTTAYCFLAIADYVKSFPVSESVKVTVKEGSNETRLSGSNYLLQYELADPEVKETVTVSNSGEGPVFARMIRSGIPVEGGEITENKNLTISAVYRTMDGTPLNVNELTQGTNFKLEVTVSNPGISGDCHELALTQIFPSGWEIINTRLEQQEQAGGSDTEEEYTDIRDDRVLKYFDLKANRKKTFTVLLNAAYQGRYYMPAISVEAMYDDTRYARIAGSWVEVKDE
jgi:uncharacterized protein YfaS (alpha-2-macroglobulin family)